MTDVQSTPPQRPRLRRSLTTFNSTVIGVASTAPAYSLAVSIGLLAAAVGTAAPVALLLSVVPMVVIALCYRELNQAVPDCGTSFAWTRRAFGLRFGWLVGWASIAASLLVMSNLAQVSAIYGLDFVGLDAAADSKVAQAVVGTLVITTMAYLAYRGIQLAARIQIVLLALELVAIVIFAAVALVKADGLPGLSAPEGSSWTLALLVGVFLYWGWDSSFSVNEESQDPHRSPGIAAVVANLVLVVIYVVVAYAAIAYAGADRLISIGEDDFFALLGAELMGSIGGQLLTLAVLSSALASTQTTILPAARSLFAMAEQRAFPRVAGTVSARYFTPSGGTWIFAGLSAILYIVLVLTSEQLLADSVAATAVLIALYYGCTCLAVPVFFRGELTGQRNITFRVVLPLLAVVFCAALLAGSFDDMSVATLTVLGIVALFGVIGAVASKR